MKMTNLHKKMRRQAIEDVIRQLKNCQLEIGLTNEQVEKLTGVHYLPEPQMAVRWNSGTLMDDMTRLAFLYHKTIRIVLV